MMLKIILAGLRQRLFPRTRIEFERMGTWASVFSQSRANDGYPLISTDDSVKTVIRWPESTWLQRQLEKKRAQQKRG